MKLTIEPTDEIATLGGVDVRVWKGHAEDGTDVIVLVPASASPINPGEADVMSELISVSPPGFRTSAYDAGLATHCN